MSLETFSYLDSDATPYQVREAAIGKIGTTEPDQAGPPRAKLLVQHKKAETQAHQCHAADKNK